MVDPPLIPFAMIQKSLAASLDTPQRVLGKNCWSKKKVPPQKNVPPKKKSKIFFLAHSDRNPKIRRELEEKKYDNIFRFFLKCPKKNQKNKKKRFRFPGSAANPLEMTYVNFQKHLKLFFFSEKKQQG